MNSPVLIPFEPFHLDHYTPGVVDRIGFDPEQLKAAAPSFVGRAVSVICSGRVIGFGIWQIDNKTATVSVFMSDELRKRKVFLNKEIMHWAMWLGTQGVKKIKASACVSISKRWLEFLGFKATGEKKEINGVTADIYVKEMA